MTDREKWFYSTKVFGENGLQSVLSGQERLMHHSLDNYSMNMSKELRGALEGLETAYRQVRAVIRQEAEAYVKDS